MTNYNERVYELEEQFLADYRNWNDGHWDYNGLDPKQKFQQAITSLIKELVAEAKPEPIDIYTHSNAKTNEELQKIAIDQFEQNLLKALEEQ